MANPFGEVIDDYKLEEMPRYNGKPKTQEDRAREAMRVINGERNEDAKQYVLGVKDDYGTGASTLCMIYNGTGDTLYYAYDTDYHGTLGRTPYPTEIGNGQWASFLHVHTRSSLAGSEAAVIYRGKQKDGHDREFTLAWSTPFAAWFDNKAYCEMSDVDHSSSWATIQERTEKSSQSDKVDMDDMVIRVSTASGSSPIFTATLTIPYRD